MSQSCNLNDDAVTGLSSPRPAAIPHIGTWAALEPISIARHCDELFAVGHDGKAGQAIWDYLPYGPFTDEAAVQNWRAMNGQNPVMARLRRWLAGSVLVGLGLLFWSKTGASSQPMGGIGLQY